ncbi:MerR family transcriptional regulator [Fructobacillus sp. M2-14]|uniref:MerR family transcriptional regulator n=1 Tax=Fructobacillus broussonetiae TaxID=2713173 RepID=A0ABS5QXW7_9LACO|nr:MerR family transcriptional regulator [Fructobacillus broussonetiae]
MKNSELQRNKAVLPMSVVRELTLLTDRQIRYYEEHGLVKPERGKGGQRRFSLNDIDQLLRIKDHLDAGDSTKDIRELFDKSERKKRQQKEEQDAKLRRALQDEFAQIARFNQSTNRNNRMQ